MGPLKKSRNGRIQDSCCGSVDYSTWKRWPYDGLWGIVSGTETAPVGAGEQAEFASRRDRALATIVLAIDPKLLYLIGVDPTDPVVVWKP